MPIIQTRYIYYIVFEKQLSQTSARSGGQAERSAIELALREKITSISHLEEIGEYIARSLQQKAQAGQAGKKKSRKKASAKAASGPILILHFQLLRTQTRWFVKGEPN